MAGIGSRRAKPKGDKEKELENTRSKFLKDISDYYSKQKKKWGMKGVSLSFTNRKGTGQAAGYRGTGKRTGKIQINIPESKNWSDFFKSEGRVTSALAEGKKLVRHEMAHHRQRLKEDVGRANPKDSHGSEWKKQEHQIGGKSASKAPPKRPKKKSKPTRGSFKEIEGKLSRKKTKPRTPRTGPPKDAPIKRRKNQGNIRNRA